MIGSCLRVFYDEFLRLRCAVIFLPALRAHFKGLVLILDCKVMGRDLFFVLASPVHPLGESGDEADRHAQGRGGVQPQPGTAELLRALDHEERQH